MQHKDFWSLLLSLSKLGCVTATRIQCLSTPSAPYWAFELHYHPRTWTGIYFHQEKVGKCIWSKSQEGNKVFLFVLFILQRYLNSHLYLNCLVHSVLGVSLEPEWNWRSAVLKKRQWESCVLCSASSKIHTAITLARWRLAAACQHTLWTHFLTSVMWEKSSTALPSQLCKLKIDSPASDLFFCNKMPIIHF